MMSIKRAMMVGLICFIVALCVLAPASLASSLVYRHSQQHVQLADAQGTLWHGSADVLLQAEANEAGVKAGHVRWQLFPLQLLLGRVYASLHWNEAPPFWLTLESTRMHVEHAVIDVPVVAISQFVPAMKIAQLGGNVSLRTDSFSVSRDAIQGLATLDWSQASSPLTQVSMLGNYHAKINGVQNGLNIQLNSTAGPLLLEGNGTWSQATGFNFNGNAKAENGKLSELVSVLHVLGNEQAAGSGVFLIQLKVN